MKQRCHVALQGSYLKIFGLREEHRVSQDLFQAIHIEMHGQDLHWTWIPGTPVYSLNNRHFVTWEHTQVMLMFLRCLQFFYAGGLPQRVSGCWRDIWFQPDPRQPDGIRRREGLGFQRSMDQYGYAWFQDKLNWDTMTFRHPFAPYIVFNNPSLQAAYRARYVQVRDIHQWMQEFSVTLPCLELLEDLLQQLYLCTSVKSILIGNHIAVKSVDTLYTWLWEWKDGHYDWHGYEIIQQVRGQAQAWKWKRALRTSFIQSHWLLPYPYSRGFIHKSKESGQEVWWSSYHDRLNRHYCLYYEPEYYLPVSYHRYYPTELWRHGRGLTLYIEYAVAPEMKLVRLAEEKLYKKLLQIADHFSKQPQMVFNLPLYIGDENYLSQYKQSWSPALIISQELVTALDEYNVLQHSCQLRYHPHRKHAVSSPPDTAEDEITSDKESLENRKNQLRTQIQKLKPRFYEAVAADWQKYQLPELYCCYLREIKPRLQWLAILYTATN
ncbi:hypothetical protein BDV23DRAFT_177429 [Aspergillus alliaceus]|uniref:Uncharacterized protein n=1 Tax=Petromyces alliaceus TaxID=209559 RepID=A0A5N7BQ23_PETAA|nr:hypothetical protein BDV23DRAFT_177429 [Aspergillus alliaceus]